MVLTTSRLRLEPAGADHVDLMVQLNADPEVMRLILGRSATPDETRDEWTERLGPRTDELRGLGYWVGFAGDDFVGWWGASSFAGNPTVAGIGYRLVRAAWGRGYATEGARAMIGQAFAAREIDRVVASTMAVNIGSAVCWRRSAWSWSTASFAIGANQSKGRSKAKSSTN